MTIRVTVILTSVSAVSLYVFSLLWPSDPYFFFASPNLGTAIARLAIAAVIVYLSFKQRFIYKRSNRIVTVLGAGLVVFGLAGLVVPSLDYALFNVIRPFDYIYAIGMGCIGMYYSLVLRPGYRKLHAPRLVHELPLRMANMGPKA